MRAVERVPRVRSWNIAASVGILLIVTWLFAFLAVWVGTWSLEPGTYDSARAWWMRFALPRAAWSLTIGVPVGVIVAVLTAHVLKTRK